jgi:hypothetical protein
LREATSRELTDCPERGKTLMLRRELSLNPGARRCCARTLPSSPYGCD